MRKLAKLIFINILVFLGLLLILNLSSILVFKIYKLNRPHRDLRVDLPNYKNIEWAAKHFKEFGNLPAEYRSFIGWRRLPFKGETINIDENGIRVTPQSDKVDNSSKLVVFLGGSAMWGTGSDDKNTIPAFFANLSKGKFRSINFAETGYNAFQDYLFLKIKTIEGLRPDFIISYDGVNEVDALNPSVNPFSHARENQIRQVLHDQDRNELLSFRHFLIEPLQLFISKFKVKLGLDSSVGNFYESNLRIDKKRVKQVAIYLLESWQSSKDLADKTGAEFIGILQPNIYLGNPRRDYLNINENMKSRYQDLYADIRLILKEPKYTELSSNILDLTSAFDGDEYIYIDDIHVSPNGNRIIADRIYKFILLMNQKQK